MSGVRIDEGVVQWAVDGQIVPEETAHAALSERPLLLLMHGYGSFEGDLIGLASKLPNGFVCASPRAPLVAPAPIVNGYAWWQLAIGPDGAPLPAAPRASFTGGVAHAAAVAMLTWLDRLDDTLSDRGGLGTIVPMGFSQGGAMVTSLLRMRPRRFACGVNCSGFVATGAFDGDAELAKYRPPMFWGRDAADPIIHPSRITLMNEWAPAHTALEAHLYPGIGHSISAAELRDISQFLTAHVTGAER